MHEYTGIQTVTLTTQWKLEYESRLNAGEGVFVTRTKPGQGKTRANIELIKTLETSLTCVLNHGYADELLAEYLEAGIKAAVYPKLEEETCHRSKFSEAQCVQKLGLSIGETVCLNCQYRKTCGYRKGIQSARGSKHQICTHDRFRVLPRTAIKQKNVIIEEDATNLLAPVVHATEGFDVVALAAKKACERKPDDKTELLEALEHIQNVAEMFDKAIDTAQRMSGGAQNRPGRGA